MSLICLTEVYFDSKNKECHNEILVNPDRVMRVESTSSEDKSDAESVVYFQQEDYIFVVESIIYLKNVVRVECS